VRPGARGGEGHVESWFLKATDPQGERAIWLRWSLWASARAPGRALAEASAIAFHGAAGHVAHVATKTTVPFERAQFAARGIGLSIDDCSLDAVAAKGTVESGGRSIGYDLRIAALQGDGAAPVVHFPWSWLYADWSPAHKRVSPHPDARVDGSVDVQGERWTVAAWPAMIGHCWGSRHTPEYAWAHCNTFEPPYGDVLFDGLCVREQVGPLSCPLLTLVTLRFEGRTHRFQGIASATLTPRRWSFRAHTPARAELSGEIWADTDDFVGLFQRDPDGTASHTLDATLARAELALSLPGRPVQILVSRRTALELGTRDPHHGVRMYV
jgi:hypothetical protein